VDFAREALIGIAPLLAGSAAVVLIGHSRLAIDSMGAALVSGNLWHFLELLRIQVHTSDILIWLYLLFSLSNTMLPSTSDWRAWPTVCALLAAIGAGLYAAGVGQVVSEAFSAPLANGVKIVASACTITVALNLLIAPLVFLIEWVLWQVSPDMARTG
jgi:hypothetical protein